MKCNYKRRANFSLSGHMMCQLVGVVGLQTHHMVGCDVERTAGIWSSLFQLSSCWTAAGPFLQPCLQAHNSWTAAHHSHLTHLAILYQPLFFFPHSHSPSTLYLDMQQPTQHMPLTCHRALYPCQSFPCAYWAFQSLHHIISYKGQQHCRTILRR